MTKGLLALCCGLLLLPGLACSPRPDAGVSRTTPPVLESLTPTIQTIEQAITQATVKETIVLSPTTVTFTDVVFKLIPDDETTTNSDWHSGYNCTPTSYSNPFPKPTGYLKIAGGGTLDGKCEQIIGAQTYSGIVTGKVDFSAGTVTFHMEGKLSETYEGILSTISMVYQGEGWLTNANSAEGTSTWSLACRQAGLGGLTCGEKGGSNELSIDVTGSTPWKMTFFSQ